MINMRTLLNIVCTEAIEGDGTPDLIPEKSTSNLPPIKYTLQLIKDSSNGKLYWIE